MASEDVPTTFAQAWERSVEARSDETFLIFEGLDGRTVQWTYGDFDLLVARTAGLLVAKGVTPGDCVHVALANCPAFVAVWLASVRLGAWFVPSDPMGGVDELAGHIARTRPVVGFCASAR
ncbi:MAG: AMP-binding protein, partial [Acidimicrobiales bacterium]|nr:AMP-binding protein [Acidimicrobiales bacterium]